MEKTYPTVLPKSLTGQAIAYAYAIWPRMKNYLKDGRLMINNNLAENAIRPMALSRKNCRITSNPAPGKILPNSCQMSGEIWTLTQSNNTLTKI